MIPDELHCGDMMAVGIMKWILIAENPISEHGYTRQPWFAIVVRSDSGPDDFYVGADGTGWRMIDLLNVGGASVNVDFTCPHA